MLLDKMYIHIAHLHHSVEFFTLPNKEACSIKWFSNRPDHPTECGKHFEKYKEENMFQVW